jgi:hypothetical protein
MNNSSTNMSSEERNWLGERLLVCSNVRGSIEPLCGELNTMGAVHRGGARTSKAPFSPVCINTRPVNVKSGHVYGTKLQLMSSEQAEVDVQRLFTASGLVC